MVILVHVSVTCWWQGIEIRVVVGSGYQVSLRPEARDVKILAGKLIFAKDEKLEENPRTQIGINQSQPTYDARLRQCWEATQARVTIIMWFSNKLPDQAVISAFALKVRGMVPWFQRP